MPSPGTNHGRRSSIRGGSRSIRGGNRPIRGGSRHSPRQSAHSRRQSSLRDCLSSIRGRQPSISGQPSIRDCGLRILLAAATTGEQSSQATCGYDHPRSLLRVTVVSSRQTCVSPEQPALSPHWSNAVGREGLYPASGHRGGGAKICTHGRILRAPAAPRSSCRHSAPLHLSSSSTE